MMIIIVLLAVLLVLVVLMLIRESQKHQKLVKQIVSFRTEVKHHALARGFKDDDLYCLVINHTRRWVSDKKVDNQHR